VKVELLALEPRSDLAVLGALDFDFHKDKEAFEEFVKDTRQVPVCWNDYPIGKAFNVHIYSQKGTWIPARAKTFHHASNIFWMEADEPVVGGMSGGPIVNDSGELVGIVSEGSDLGEDGNPHDTWCRAPDVHLALPVWVCRTIKGGSMKEQPE
jgi:hypothetical protein